MMVMVKIMIKVQRHMVGVGDDVDGEDFCPVQMSYVVLLPEQHWCKDGDDIGQYNHHIRMLMHDNFFFLLLGADQLCCPPSGAASAR